MNLRDYLRVLKRGWWLIVVLALIGGGVGALVSSLSPLSFRATSTVFISIDGALTANDLQVGNVFAMQRVQSYAELASTSAVLSRVSAAVDGEPSVDELRSAISSSVRPETSIIDITAATEDPDRTAEWANAVAAALAQEVTSLETSGSTLSTPVTVSTVQAAEVPTIALSPQPRYNILVGLVVGLVLGLGIIVTVNAFDTRIRSIGDLPRVGGLATLTSIPVARARSRRSGGDRRMEAFRNLRANLQFGAGVRGTIAVASATAPGYAHSFANQLAAALAEIHVRVVVVDLDLRPETARRAGARRRTGETVADPGVADVLSRRFPLDSVLPVRRSSNGVVAIGAGTVDDDSSQLLSTDAMTEMLGHLNALFDYVILVCPPITERSESVVAAALAGRSLLVLESGATTKAQFLFALELLQGVGVESVSVAVDGVAEIETAGSGSTGFDAGVSTASSSARA